MEKESKELEDLSVDESTKEMSKGQIAMDPDAGEMINISEMGSFMPRGSNLTSPKNKGLAKKKKNKRKKAKASRKKNRK